MISDLVLVRGLIYSPNPAWAVLICLFMLNPYLLMYSPIATYFYNKNLFFTNSLSKMN